MINTEKMRDLAHSSRGEWDESDCELIFNAADEIDELHAQITQLKADAQRYQWLRISSSESEHLISKYACDALDGEIDAAILRAQL